MSFGLGPAGYDVRIAEGITVSAGQFFLASTVERFNIPNDILGKVCDKSTWARRGIAVQNTIIEPGWRGFLTLELTNHGLDRIVIEAGDPIAQIIFFRLEAATELPYAGKYQDQEAGPQPARQEERVTPTQTALRELDALVAAMVGKLLAPADNNPLLAVEQLRGQALRYPVPQKPPWMKRPIKNRLNAIQNCCDELHLGLRRHPDAERWSTELVAYERAEHQRERTLPPKETGP
jgi:dCTP deaminase